MPKRMCFVRGIWNWSRFDLLISVVQKWWWLSGLHHKCETLAKSKNHWKSLKVLRNDWNWLEKVREGQMSSVACGVITWSSANGAKMWKYTNSELWSSLMYMPSLWQAPLAFALSLPSSPPSTSSALPCPLFPLPPACLWVIVMNCSK